MDNSASLEMLLEYSLQQYESLKGILKQIERGLKKDINGKIAELTKRYIELEKQCRATDSQMTALFDDKDPSSHVMELLQKRGEVQKDIIQLIEEVIPEATRVKSFLASEFETIKKGRNALSGYKSNTSNHGRIVNRSS